MRRFLWIYGFYWFSRQGDRERGRLVPSLPRAAQQLSRLRLCETGCVISSRRRSQELHKGAPPATPKAKGKRHELVHRHRVHTRRRRRGHFRDHRLCELNGGFRNRFFDARSGGDARRFALTPRASPRRSSAALSRRRRGRLFRIRGHLARQAPPSRRRRLAGLRKRLDVSGELAQPVATSPPRLPQERVVVIQPPAAIAGAEDVPAPIGVRDPRVEQPEISISQNMDHNLPLVPRISASFGPPAHGASRARIVSMTAGSSDIPVVPARWRTRASHSEPTS